jgi:hypothetical protein
MASEVTWFEEGKIILIRNTGFLSVEDVLEQSNQLMVMMSAADHKISIIDDLSALISVDPKLALLPFTTPQALRFAQHRNLDIIALVGMGNSLVAFAFEVVSKVSKTLSSQKFNTIEEAAAWLKEVETVRETMQAA